MIEYVWNWKKMNRKQNFHLLVENKEKNISDLGKVILNEGRELMKLTCRNPFLDCFKNKNKNKNKNNRKKFRKKSVKCLEDIWSQFGCKLLMICWLFFPMIYW